MIKYEFMRAHGKGSEGSEKRGGGAKRKRGCEKKGGAPHPPFFKKGGARSTGTPLCTPLVLSLDSHHHDRWAPLRDGSHGYLTQATDIGDQPLLREMNHGYGMSGTVRGSHYI